ncbi:hypothetical protein [Mobilicoccus caccae]|uniref:Uncharacterized protein n=1 Tax=Mobilicoccus caccae TaxID=1859295 RepID=A0ABQ6ILP7_9MICO|nr:hypothetical protein [Mobilicoccus caccae]GMA38026.1 hypothetical protein GCM10025883_00710 [Mobilicoccus caccae]
MTQRTAYTIAVLLTIAFGLGFALLDGDKGRYAIIGGPMIAAVWVLMWWVAGRRTDGRPNPTLHS